jgi:hypothetical protein
LLFFQIPNPRSGLVKHLPILLAQPCIPNLCLITLLGCYANLVNFWALVFKLGIFYSRLPEFMSLCMSARSEH